MVAWLSSIKEKNLNDCGKFVLTGDMSEFSITKVHLSNMNTLEGTLGSRSVVHDAPQSNTLVVELPSLPPSSSFHIACVHWRRGEHPNVLNPLHRTAHSRSPHPFINTLSTQATSAR